MSDHNLAEALTDDDIHSISRQMPEQPWGIGSRWKSALSFARAVIAADRALQALAAHEAGQQAGEAVAVVRHGNIKPGIPWTDVMWLGTPPPNGTKLFTHPQQPLTREQIGKVSADAHIAFCLDKYPTYEVALARAIEAELGITKDTK